jgi:adenylate kinase
VGPDLKVCPQCGGELFQRDDDKAGPVRRRLEVYQQQTQPLIEYYRETGRLVPIDGMGEIGFVHLLVLKALYKDRV